MSQSAGNNRAKNKSSGRPEVKVFISWSGPTSEKLGDAIRNWLPNVIQSIEPYFTPADVDKGASRRDWSDPVSAHFSSE